MKIYHSFSETDFVDLNSDLYSLHEMSVLSCLKSYGNIHLITSKRGAEFFHKLPYTSIELIDEYFPEYDISIYSDDPRIKNTWTIPKMLSYKQIIRKGEPFLHVDYDLFLFKRLPDYINNAPVVAHHRETRNDLGYWYYLPIFEELCPNKPFYNKYIDYSINCGVFGGNNLSFFNFYLDTAFDLFKNVENYSYWAEAHEWVMKIMKAQNMDSVWNFQAGILEQYWLAQCLKLSSIEPTFIFDSTGSYDLWDFASKSTSQAERLGVTHLISHTKKEPQVLAQVRKKISQMKSELGLYY